MPLIEQKQVNKKIINALKDYCGCELIFANSNSDMPPYPFISCTIITPSSGNSGTYCVQGEEHYREISQVWSITVQSTDDMESLDIVYKAYDFLSNMGCVYLSENGIIVNSLTNITNRDTLLTFGYEFRKGFDVEFNLLDKVENPITETIEKFEIQLQESEEDDG